MNQPNAFQIWLEACQEQFKRFIAWRAIALSTILVVAFTLLAAWLGYRYAYAGQMTLTLRLLLLASLLAGGWILLWSPWQAIKRNRGVDLIEKRIPQLDGRLRTLEELRRANAHHPMLGLLSKDAESRTASIPPTDLVNHQYLSAFKIGASLAVAVLLWLLLFAPGNWSFGARNYLAGWFLGGTPPQFIQVVPGDGRIKRGSNFDMQAITEGFAPREAIVYAQYDGQEWQEIPMRRNGDGQFSFRFYGVHDPLTYYINAAGVSSQRYRIDVVDVPNIQQISLLYEYPQWTGLDDRSQEFGTAIQGVEGTKVTLNIVTDRPLNSGEISVNDQITNLETDGNISRVTFELSESGQYFLTDRYDGDLIRLTEAYPIRVLDDAAPTITAVKPGGDWSATNIEEVVLRFRAQDDYQIADARLLYSVNGGEWQERVLEGGAQEVDLEQLLYLEDMAQDQGGLVPGDLITYYVEVGDRLQKTSSDIYFIDVQPFAKRYSQSQQAGGAGAGGGGGTGQDEISSRQREILVATWNLIKRRDNSADPADPQYLEDNADMLSELQLTLAEQTDTLIQRAQARRLDQADADITRFIESLEEALVSMDPAVTHLDATELDESIPGQQRALQHLLRAEAVFRDINVSMQRGGGGGAGGNAARDMADIYELEMDLSKNQYETRQPATMQEPEAAMDDAFEQLRELANRQEQLAEQARNNGNMSLNQRWQQDQLRREAERLREQLERMQQSASTDPSQRAAAENLQRQLDNVIEDMRQASGQPGQQPQPGQGGSSSAANSASQQLRESLDDMTAARQQELRNNLDRFSRDAQAMRQEQGELDARLQDALAEAMAERRETGAYSSGLNAEEQSELAERKRELAEQVRSLQNDLAQTAERMTEDMLESSTALEDAINLLRVTRLDARLEEAADSIDFGMAPSVASREATTTEIINALQEDLETARQVAAVELNQSDQSESQLTTEQQLRQLRQQLSSNLNPENPGTTQSGELNPQGGSSGVARGGWGGGYDDWDYRDLGPLPEDFRSADIAEQANITSAELLALSNELINSGISEQQLQEAQRLARSLALNSGNDETTLVALQSLLNQLERLELEISSSQDFDQRLPVSGVEESEASLKDSVADYFKRLSERATQ